MDVFDKDFEVSPILLKLYFLVESSKKFSYAHLKLVFFYDIIMKTKIKLLSERFLCAL